MPLNADISTALQLLEHIQHTIDVSDDAKLQAQTNDDLNLLIAVLENPIFRGIVSVQDSLSELNQQMQQHPSILPVDFDITSCGDLVINVPPPADIYDAEYDPDYKPSQELDDQRVPVAKLSNSSSAESASPKMTSPSLAPGAEGAALAPITTPTYAIEFQKAIEESSQGREVITVQLYKPDGSSLGFSVVGLRSEEKGELGIFVQEIQNTGIAGRDGRLHEGDQILAIDGQPLDSNISHQQAINILQKARGLVELVVARNDSDEEHLHPLSPALSPTPSLVDRSPSAVSDTSKAGSDMVLNTEWAQVEIIDLINDGSGLGFGIIGGRSTGVVVKTILPGGVADRDNRLQSGDHILQIGEVNLRGMGSEQVAAVLRQSGSHVRLVVARPVEPTSPDYQALGSHAPIVPTKILGDPEELDRHLLQNGYPETFNTHPAMHESYDNQFIFGQHDNEIDLHPDPGLVVDVVRNPMPIRAATMMSSAPSLPLLTMDMMPLDTDPLPEVEEFTVNLKKDYHGLGITIAGYVCEKEELSGIFVKSISEGSAADSCKRIAVNDRIVEVDSQSLQGYTNHQAVEVLRATGQTVHLRLERYLRGPKYEQLQQAIAASEQRPPTPSSPSAASLPRFPVSMDGEDTEIEVEGESHTTIDSMILETVEAANTEVLLFDVEALIDDNYEGVLSATVEAAIQVKWAKVMTSPDMEIVVAQLCKLSEGGGLGISLEGTVDVEDGQEVRPHHYIRSILPEGPVGTNGKLRSGDELLEVNGHRLLGMNHIEVVTILKDLPMSVRMVCARRPGELAPYRLIDTSQDRAAFAARSILGGSLQNLIPASDRLVKAKSDGSLASTTTTATATDASFSKVKSRSLEPLTGLAMWSSEPQMIELTKGERGLGFSILDYQDPMNPNETVIVIRSLVPGGVAQMDGRLIPGDRLLFVNDTDLENASLDQAVQALKGAVKGVVRIGVAKPLPIPESVTHSQEFLSQATPTLDDHSMFSSSGSLSPAGSDLEQEAGDVNAEPDQEPPPLPSSLPPTDGAQDELDDDLVKLMVPVASERVTSSRTGSLGDNTDDEEVEDEEIAACWASEIQQLPASLERDIRIHKGAESLGLSVDCVDKGVNGMLVVAVASGGAIFRDKRVAPGDFLVSVNNESLRNVTNSQARAILRRAQLLSADISVSYIPSEVATAYRRSASEGEAALPPAKQTIQISPRIFPDYYRSPFISKENKSPLPSPSEQTNVKPSEQLKTSSVNVKLVAVTQFPIHESEPTTPVTYTSVRTLEIERLSPSKTTSSETDACDDSVIKETIPESAVVPVPITRRDSRQEDKVFVSQIQLRTTPTKSSSPEVRPTEPSTPDSVTSASDTTVMTVTHRDPGYASSPAMDDDAPTVLLAKHWGPERAVEVLREPNCSLGISIVGGKVDLYNAGPDSGSAISGIFIKNVLPHSPAGRTGELKTGDRILEVDGIDLRLASHERAVDVIRAAGNPVSFLVQSLIQWNVNLESSHATEVASTSSAGAVGGSSRRKAHAAPAAPPSPGELMKVTPMLVPNARVLTPELIQEGRSIDAVDKKPASRQSRKYSINKEKAPLPPSTSSHQLRQSIKEEKSQRKYSSDEDDDEDEEDVRELEGRIYTKKGHEIHRASAGNVKRSKEEIDADPEEEDDYGYTKNKVKKKYASLGEGVVMVQLERGHQGLGLSIAGHKDRNRMAVFVVGMNPNGVASKTGNIRVGDEILEVNGVVVQGRCHLNASAIIKGLPGPVFKVILLRREAAIEELAVKPITQFPVTLDDETPEERYSNFKGLRTVTIKKPSLVDISASPVQQGTQGLGIMIIEGKHAEVGQGIFISDIQEGSAAEQAGLIVGDMILSVNKDTLLGSNYDAAASLLKKTEGVVTLVVCNPNKTKEEEKKTEGGLTVGDGKSTPARSPTPTQQRPVSPAPPEKPRILPKPTVDSARFSLPPKSVSKTNMSHAVPATLDVPIATPAEPPKTLDFALPPVATSNITAIPTLTMDIDNPTSAVIPLSPTSDTVSLSPTSETAPLLPTLETAPLIPASDTVPLYPKLDTAPLYPTLDTALLPSTSDTDSLSPTSETTPLLASDTAPLYPKLDTAPLYPTLDTAPLYPTLDTAMPPAPTLETCPPPLTLDASATPALTLDLAPQSASSSDAVSPVPQTASSSDSISPVPQTASSSDAILPVPQTASSLDAISPTTPDVSPSSTLRLSPTPSICEEPAADLLTCEIETGKETTIEINREKLGLGLSIVGGSDTLLGVVAIQEIYPDGAAAKDNRLKPGDQILEINAEDCRSIPHAKALAALRQIPAKVKMIVFRDEALTKDDNILETIDVELTKKSGKGLGLSLVARKAGTGVFIADVLAGGTADSDGRLLKGDQVLSVNGQDLKSSTQEEAAAVLKTAAGKVAIKLGRLKTGARGVAALAAKESSLSENVPPNGAENNGTLSPSAQTLPRYVSKREALIRQFTNWSFRRRNL